MFNQFLINRFQFLSRGHFNGKLNIQSVKGEKWSVFFWQGQLIWCSGGNHASRRWKRQLLKHFPEIAPNSVGFREGDQFECWQYHALSILIKRYRMNEEKVKNLISSIVGEVLFDIMMQAAVGQLNFSINQQKIVDPPLILLNPEESLKFAYSSWENWQKSGLAKISPDFAPIIKDHKGLQAQTNATIYNNFNNFFNGNNTIRDLAVQMKQEVLLVARSLIPYIRQGVISFKIIPDLPPLVRIDAEVKTTTEPIAVDKPAVNEIKPVTIKEDKSSLIACVDDSPQTCNLMSIICENAGYEFMSIQDPIQALPTLIQLKPDLIFVDLLMPVVNGYEIITQLRRTAVFNNTPIIILTGSNGIVDRVRAKMIGANEFVNKPVENDKIIAVIQKYLSDHIPFNAENNA